MTPRILVRIHGILLRGLPGRLQSRYSNDIQALLSENLYRRFDRSGKRAMLLYWAGAMWDTARTSILEQAGRLKGRPRRRAIDPPRLRPARRGKGLPMETILQDLRFGIRGLLKRPGFTITAILTLAVGIGANSAILSIVNSVLLRPLNAANPEELVGCYSKDTQNPDSFRAFSYPNYRDLRDNNAVFTSLAAQDFALVGLREGDSTRRSFAGIISSNYFSTFGVPLFFGRAFNDEEERPGSDIPVAILSHAYWQRLGSNRNILGQTVTINGGAYEIVGVAVEGFTGSSVLVTPDVWLPLGTHESVTNDFTSRAGMRLEERANHRLILVGRLLPDISRQEADAQLAVVAARLEDAFPRVNEDQTFIVHPLPRVSVTTAPSDETAVSAMAAVLMTMAGLVLVIACLNLANMEGARGAARRGEFAVRLALGSGRSRVLRQLLTESLLLSILGGGAGLVLAFVGPSLLAASITNLIPITLQIDLQPDWRVLIATLGFCFLSSLLFGLGPALKLSRRDLSQDLKDRQGDGPRGGRAKLLGARQLPVLAETALALMLLVVAGLFLSGALKAANVRPGFQMESAILIETDVSLLGIDEERGRPLYLELLRRLRDLPGVSSASLAAIVPFGSTHLGQAVRRAGDSSEDAVSVTARYNTVGTDYFKTMGIPLLRGRAFLPNRDHPSDSARVAILDATLAERLWPDEDALGRWVRFPATSPDAEPVELEVVGIVSPVQSTFIALAARPEIYVPFGFRYQSSMHLHLATRPGGRAATESLMASVRTVFRDVDARLPILSLKTLRTHVDESVDMWMVRAGASIFSIFGGLALFLAVVGVYGVRAYNVTRRTREIGIRMALGSTRRNALWLILREGLKLTVLGSLAGIVLAILFAQLVAGFLYDVQPDDPWVFLIAPLVLAAASVLACLIPARRAARVDPSIALRYE